MKQCELKVGVDYLRLKVKFACKISLALKYRTFLMTQAPKSIPLLTTNN